MSIRLLCTVRSVVPSLNKRFYISSRRKRKRTDDYSIISYLGTKFKLRTRPVLDASTMASRIKLREEDRRRRKGGDDEE